MPKKFLRSALVKWPLPAARARGSDVGGYGEGGAVELIGEKTVAAGELLGKGGYPVGEVDGLLVDG